MFIIHPDNIFMILNMVKYVTFLPGSLCNIIAVGLGLNMLMWDLCCSLNNNILARKTDLWENFMFKVLWPFRQQKTVHFTGVVIWRQFMRTLTHSFDCKAGLESYEYAWVLPNPPITERTNMTHEASSIVSKTVSRRSQTTGQLLYDATERLKGVRQSLLTHKLTVS